MALRDLFLNYDSNVTEKWYYKLPCFFINGKLFSYIWIEKKSNTPYIAFYPGKKLNHPLLIKGNRTHSKILKIAPDQDLPIEIIDEIIQQSFKHYK